MIGDVLAPTHLLLILLVALLVLGPKRLPEVGRSLGKGLRDFKEAMTSYSPDALLNPEEPQPPTPSPAPAPERHTVAGSAEPASEPASDAATHSAS